jgi:hypothetical protein
MKEAISLSIQYRLKILPQVMGTQCADRALHAQVAGTTTTVVSLVNCSSHKNRI